MSKSPNQTSKAKAWTAFSLYIRTRDCLNTTGLPFVGVCITCGKRYHIKALQAGHALPGRGNAKLFDEELVNAQCMFCNMHKHGKTKKYHAKMRKKYGKKRFEEMKIDSKKVIPNRDMHFDEIEQKYKQKLNELIEAVNDMKENSHEI